MSEGVWTKVLEGTTSEIDAMTPEAKTLFLARAGMSPLDVEASLQRALAMIDRLALESKGDKP
jgi:hypothetical protein